MLFLNDVYIWYIKFAICKNYKHYKHYKSKQIMNLGQWCYIIIYIYIGLWLEQLNVAPFYIITFEIFRMLGKIYCSIYLLNKNDKIWLIDKIVLRIRKI